MADVETSGKVDIIAAPSTSYAGSGSSFALLAVFSLPASTAFRLFGGSMIGRREKSSRTEASFYNAEVRCLVPRSRVSRIF